MKQPHEPNNLELITMLCGESNCNNFIGDFSDDLGGWYQNTENGYLPVCEECWVYKGGER